MHSDEKLWKQLDGELSPTECEAIDKEARTDAALAARLDEFRLMKRDVLAGAPKPPVDFPDRAVRAATSTARLVFDLQAARRKLKAVLIAAAVLAAVGLTLFVVGGPGLFEVPDIGARDLIRSEEDLDRRVEEFEKAYDLDEKQVLQTREILGRHDAEVERLRKRVLMERQREFDTIHDRYRSKIREILTPEQLERYNKEDEADKEGEADKNGEADEEGKADKEGKAD